jgi:hypothetical protein
MKTKVVHCSRSVYDVYIGRGPDPLTGEPSRWGNPFVIGKDGTRAEVIRKHREWILRQPELVAMLHELRGKRLGCWCSGVHCHGETLAELAEGQPEKVTMPERQNRNGDLFD